MSCSLLSKVIVPLGGKVRVWFAVIMSSVALEERFLLCFPVKMEFYLALFRKSNSVIYGLLFMSYWICFFGHG